MYPRSWFVAAALPMVLFIGRTLIQAQVKEIATIESRDLTGVTTPSRVVVAQTQSHGHSTETRTESPLAGGFETWTETERETDQANPNATTVIQRQYVRNIAGKRVLLAVVEEQRTTAADGRETVVRTTSSADVIQSQYIIPRLQVVQREVEEIATISDDSHQTTSVVFRQTGNGLQPVESSQSVTLREGTVSEERTTILRPDGGGNFMPIGRTESTTTKTESGYTKEERIFHDLGSGKMSVIQRDVTTESTAGHEIHRSTLTYSAFVPGKYLAPGIVELVQQVRSSRRRSPDGSAESRVDITRPDHLDPAKGMQLATSVRSILRPLPDGTSEPETFTHTAPSNQVRPISDANAASQLPTSTSIISASQASSLDIVRGSECNRGFPLRITDGNNTRVIP